MLVTTQENQILEKIFLANYNNLNEPKTKRFRVENFELVNVIDELRNSQLIKEKDFVYRLTLNGFAALNSKDDTFKLVKAQCQAIFTVLKQHYLQFYGEESLTISSIAEQISTDRNKILTAVYFVAETNDLVCGRSNDFSKEDAGITPYEKALMHESFESALDVHRKWIKERLDQQVKLKEQYKNGQPEYSRDMDFLGETYDFECQPLRTQQEKRVFVDNSRINELEELNNTLPEFDLSKIIQICCEMNSTYSTGSFYSLASLQRMLIDHIPPLFDSKNFSEVANNYGAKSFKKHMLHLDKSLRNISDSFLHQHVRKVEPLPNNVTINFSSAIDELLIEIIRLNKARQNNVGF